MEQVLAEPSAPIVDLEREVGELSSGTKLVGAAVGPGPAPPHAVGSDETVGAYVSFVVERDVALGDGVGLSDGDDVGGSASAAASAARLSPAPRAARHGAASGHTSTASARAGRPSPPKSAEITLRTPKNSACRPIDSRPQMEYHPRFESRHSYLIPTRFRSLARITNFHAARARRRRGERAPATSRILAADGAARAAGGPPVLARRALWADAAVGPDDPRHAFPSPSVLSSSLSDLSRPEDHGAAPPPSTRRRPADGSSPRSALPAAPPRAAAAPIRCRRFARRRATSRSLPVARRGRRRDRRPRRAAPRRRGARGRRRGASRAASLGSATRPAAARTSTLSTGSAAAAAAPAPRSTRRRRRRRAAHASAAARRATTAAPPHQLARRAAASSRGGGGPRLLGAACLIFCSRRSRS